MTSIRLPNIDGSVFDLKSLKGKRYLLSFYRFAQCPFCNLQVHKLITRYNELPDNFEIVTIFDSTLKDFQKESGDKGCPFPILADEKNTYYKEYGVERSWIKTIKGGIVGVPDLLRSIFLHRKVPTSFSGNLSTMPCDLLVDQNGVIEMAHYGQGPGHHLSFDQILSFAKG